MTTNLVLDARQRAMLAEMGVRVWLPLATDAKPTKTVLAELVEAPALRQAQGERTAQDAHLIPVRREPPLRLPVLSSPPAALSAAPARYVIGNMPSDAAGFDFILLGEICTGDAEKLLANMAKVLGSSVFAAQMVAVQNETESLADQLLNLPAKVIVALGPHAANALMGEASGGVPFGKLRGSAYSLDGLGAKAIVTYHPLQLLRQPLAKAQTWLDLKLAMKETK